MDGIQATMAIMIRTVVLSLLLVACALAKAQDALSPEDAFRKGIELSETKRHREAIPYYLIAYRAFPQSESVLWNLGLASAEVEEHSEALRYWLALREQHPDNWRVFAKLVQAYQALGDADSRDRERAALIALRQSSTADPDLARTATYCREQMAIAGRKIYAFEIFEPRGEWMVFFEFIVVSDSGKEDFKISLGSYELTNRMAWEAGNLSRDKRIYHLDRYQGRDHWAYGFLDSRPTYDAVRAQIADILNGRTKPVSSTTVR